MKNLKLSNDEILILSDWLSDFVGSEQFDNLESSQKRVLADLDSQLEQINDYIISENYQEALDKAKSSVKF